MNHLESKVVGRALQNERVAHVRGGVVEVEDDIIGAGWPFGPKHPIDLLRSPDFVGQFIHTRGTLEK